MRLLALIFLFALLNLSVDAGSAKRAEPKNDTGRQIVTLPGVPKWHLFPHLWSYKSVDISCPNQQVGVSSRPAGQPLLQVVPQECGHKCTPLQDFDVFTAQDNHTLAQKILDGDTAWCGFERLFSGHKQTCNLSVTPFETTHICIVPIQGLSLFSAGMSTSLADLVQTAAYRIKTCLMSTR